MTHAVVATGCEVMVKAGLVVYFERAICSSARTILSKSLARNTYLTTVNVHQASNENVYDDGPDLNKGIRLLEVIRVLHLLIVVCELEASL